MYFLLLCVDKPFDWYCIGWILEWRGNTTARGGHVAPRRPRPRIDKPFDWYCIDRILERRGNTAARGGHVAPRRPRPRIDKPFVWFCRLDFGVAWQHGGTRRARGST
jgi:hypothetical protein